MYVPTILHPSSDIHHISLATIRHPAGCYEIYLPEGSMTWQRTNPGGSLVAPDTCTWRQGYESLTFSVYQFFDAGGLAVVSAVTIGGLQL